MLTDEIKKVLAARDVSFWLKRAIRENLNRDPVDAVKDAALLHDLLEERCSLILAIAMDHDPSRFKEA